MNNKATIERNHKKVEEYMALPYRIEMVPDDDGWFVSIPDLPGCISQGATPEEALEMVRDAQRLWLQASLEAGNAVPMPGAREDYRYSGKFNVRVPKDLHRDLAVSAAEQGVSLNLFVATALASAVSGNRVQIKTLPDNSTVDKPPSLREEAVV